MTVSPEDAQAVLNSGDEMNLWHAAADLAHTVATEPDRIRAAVVKALRWAAIEDLDETNRQVVMARADAIKNGADW